MARAALGSPATRVCLGEQQTACRSPQATLLVGTSASCHADFQRRCARYPARSPRPSCPDVAVGLARPRPRQGACVRLTRSGRLSRAWMRDATRSISARVSPMRRRWPCQDISLAWFGGCSRAASRPTGESGIRRPARSSSCCTVDRRAKSLAVSDRKRAMVGCGREGTCSSDQSSRMSKTGFLMLKKAMLLSTT